MYYIITRRPGERTGPKPASCRQRALQRKTQPSGTERHRAQPAAKVRPAAHLPLRLCKTPVGVPSGTNWAGDSANRESSQQNSSAPFAKLVLGRAHRRAMRASRPAQPRSTHCRLAEAGGPDAPLGRDALRLLLPASTLSETSRAPGPKNFPPPCYARRSLSARLGDSFYFAKSEIVESLLRRGARVPLGTRKLELARQQAKTALTPGGRCLPALGMGHSGEKTFFGRAPGRFILFCS